MRKFALQNDPGIFGAGPIVPATARMKANLFVNAWQGATVVARAGGRLEHIGRVLLTLQSISITSESEAG
jgi:hypothetical protein